LERSDVFVSTAWLADHLDAPQLRLLDASWHLPGEGRDARAEYEAEHIPGTGFFDLDAVSNPETSLPHMLAREDFFSYQMRRLGLANHQRIVVYDSGGLHAAVRAFWTFRVYGHDKVHILDGGLEKWRAEGRAVSSGWE